MTVDERLREAARDAHRAAEALPDRKMSSSRRPKPLAAVAAFVLVLVVAVPVILLQGGEGAGPSATTPDDRNVDTSEIPEEVLDYWSLQGTLQSVSDEPGWLCPPKISIGYAAIVGASAIPADLISSYRDRVRPTPTCETTDPPVTSHPAS